MAARDTIRALAVSSDEAARRIVDDVLADTATLRTSCDPMGDELLAAWRHTTDQERLDRDLARYASGADT